MSEEVVTLDSIDPGVVEAALHRGPDDRGHLIVTLYVHHQLLGEPDDRFGQPPLVKPDLRRCSAYYLHHADELHKLWLRHRRDPAEAWIVKHLVPVT